LPRGHPNRKKTTLEKLLVIDVALGIGGREGISRLATEKADTLSGGNVPTKKKEGNSKRHPGGAQRIERQGRAIHLERDGHKLLEQKKVKG